MTAREYIEQDLPFYHITPSDNRDSILVHGLRAKRCNGICVVRSDYQKIWKEIINGQLNYPAQHYLVIKLTPRKHNIRYEEVALDSTEEDGTGPLQNYIVKERIMIDESDIVENSFDRGIRSDFNEISEYVESLSGYGHPPIPDVSVFENL